MKCLITIIIKADDENEMKNNKDMVISSTRKKKVQNNSWQPKGLKRKEFYKYVGEKGA